jgi:glycosyltransferase involved in cell wall biosynthesis
MRRKLADSLRGRIYVVPNAADDLRRLGDMIGAKPEALPTGLPHNGKIILSVLGGSRYKNQVRLVEAFQRWGRKDTALVVIGDAAQLLSGMDCGPRVSILGYVSDLELVRWYKAAALFVFPSLFEGFGIPVIEAQNFGLPVVCSDLPVLREVSGGAALFVDPYSVVSLSEAMERMLSDEALRGRLIEAGYENASRYSWAHSAEILLNALRREMGGASLEL